MSKALKAFVTQEIKWAKKCFIKEKTLHWQYWHQGYEAAMTQVKYRLNEKRPAKAKRKARKG